MLVGHSWADANGIILQIDEPVADLLQRRRHQIEGRSYLEITHPADRAKNAARVAALKPGSGPDPIRKRYLTGDGGEVWIALEVARIGAGSSGHLLGSFMVNAAEKNPRRLWREATRLLDMRRMREDLIGDGLFSDHAWTILLHIYLAEAEGRLIEQSQIAQAERISPGVVMRWCDVLRGHGLVEPDLRNPAVCQLSQKGLLTLEQLLLTTAAA